MIRKRILAVCSYSPGHQAHAREALDAILASAIFGQSISVLFCGDGVLQLLPAQGDYTGSDKALDRSLAALPLYDIEHLYVDRASLNERGLQAAQLLPGVTLVAPGEARSLLRDCDRVMSF